MSSPGLRRTEAKAFFANERTFLHWMSMSVTTGSISAALLGVAGHAHRHWGSDFTVGYAAVRSCWEACRDGLHMCWSCVWLWHVGRMEWLGCMLAVLGGEGAGVSVQSKERSCQRQK